MKKRIFPLLLAASLLGAAPASAQQQAPHPNQTVINAFLAGVTDVSMARQVMELLSPEDLETVSLDVLTDTYNYSPSLLPEVAQPRIYSERLTPYRAFLRSRLPWMKLEDWAAWVSRNIQLEEQSMTVTQCATPEEVWYRRAANHISRQVFFVAGARAMGYAAYYDSAKRHAVPDMVR